MAKKKRGRRAVFSPQQNRALRVVLHELLSRFVTQKALGDAIGIEQQNVARLSLDRRAGFAYSTASTLVRLAGFASVDSFFAAKGVAPALESSIDVTAAVEHRQAG